MPPTPPTPPTPNHARMRLLARQRTPEAQRHRVRFLLILEGIERKRRRRLGRILHDRPRLDALVEDAMLGDPVAQYRMYLLADQVGVPDEDWIKARGWDGSLALTLKVARARGYYHG